MVLDTHPVLNARGMPMEGNQDDHVALCNMLNTIMAARADYYNVGKYGNDSLLLSIQKDFSKWVVTSDREIYHNDTMEAKIVSYYGSKIVAPIEKEIIIPVYNNGPRLEDVLATQEGLLYMQTAYNTKDDAKEILNTFVRLSGTSADYISVWNMGLCRKREPQQAIYLLLEKPYFYIFGCGLSGNARARSKTFHAE